MNLLITFKSRLANMLEVKIGGQCSKLLQVNLPALEITLNFGFIPHQI